METPYFGRTTSASVAKFATDRHGYEFLVRSSFCREFLVRSDFGRKGLDMPKFGLESVSIHISTGNN